MMMRVVVDTNVYISAIFWGGKPRKILDWGRDNKVNILTSADIEEEIAEKLHGKFGLEEDEIRQILADFSTFTKFVRISGQIRAVPDDPDDDKFIECAVSGKADYIVSGDRHLLQLKEYAGIKIMKVADFLSISEKW